MESGFEEVRIHFWSLGLPRVQCQMNLVPKNWQLSLKETRAHFHIERISVCTVLIKWYQDSVDDVNDMFFFIMTLSLDYHTDKFL